LIIFTRVVSHKWTLFFFDVVHKSLRIAVNGESESQIVEHQLLACSHDGCLLLNTDDTLRLGAS
jgi:hypothetical protein